jgi:hypothetical protein
MDKEPIDPVYEYVDKEIKLAKRELLDKITIVAQNLLETSKFLAQSEIERLRRALIEWSLNHLSKSTEPTYSRVRQFITDHSSAAIEKTMHTHDPISVADEFRKECRAFFKEHDLRAFRD